MLGTDPGPEQYTPLTMSALQSLLLRQALLSCPWTYSVARVGFGLEPASVSDLRHSA